ncbi:MAG: hypothetical protein ABSC92_07630 [Rhizomicrobium sp.]|jgi:hypothetical protein
MKQRRIRFCFLAAAILYAVQPVSASPQETRQMTRNGVDCLPRLPVNERPYEENVGNGLRLVYRQEGIGDRGMHQTYFLVGNSNRRDICGSKNEMTIYARLPVPHLPSGRFIAASFDCRAPSKAIVPGKPLIGIFPKINSVANRPFDAWGVDFRHRSFVKIGGAVCRSFDK